MSRPITLVLNNDVKLEMLGPDDQPYASLLTVSEEEARHIVDMLSKILKVRDECE